MPNVPLDTRFIGIAADVNLTERKSAVINQQTAPYTMQDIVDTAGGGSYLVYSALINSDNTFTHTITPIVLQNTLGVDITWAFAGTYGLNAVASEPIFLLNKTLCFATSSAINSEFVNGFGNYDEDESYVTLAAMANVGEYTQYFTRMNIEIRVYP
jgi:hypothetical protein